MAPPDPGCAAGQKPCADRDGASWTGLAWRALLGAMDLTTRDAVPTDAGAVLALWLAAETAPTHTDDVGSLRRLLEHDPGALIVAETSGQLVGTVIAGWDGWRGSIYRLAVLPSHRRRGVGVQLLRQAERRLHVLGAVRLQATVVEGDRLATSFWRASGWEEQVERVRFVRG